MNTLPAIIVVALLVLMAIAGLTGVGVSDSRDVEYGLFRRPQDYPPKPDRPVMRDDGGEWSAIPIHRTWPTAAWHPGRTRDNAPC